MEAQFVPSVMQALVTDDTATGALPELNDLHLHDSGRSPFVSNAAEQFVSMRSLSGRPVSFKGSAGYEKQKLLCFPRHPIYDLR